MPFARLWDPWFPRVYDKWQVGDVVYTIEDLAPENEREAVYILSNHFLPDEIFCAATELDMDLFSVRTFTNIWEYCFQQRVSLVCYAEECGFRTMVGLNCCFVVCKNEDLVIPFGISRGIVWHHGDGYKERVKTLVYLDNKVDAFECLNVDKLLCGFGLVVRREFRGHKIGAKLLAAREPLGRVLDVRGSKNIFPGTAAWKSATSAGFVSKYEVSCKDLADKGFSYLPKIDQLVKVMVKKYEYYKLFD